MIVVYGFKNVHRAVAGLTRDLRVIWTLEETGAEYRVQGLDHFAGDHKSPEYLALNPFGQLPAIDDDSLILTESGAIVLHLAEKAGRLVPKDVAGRAEVLRWSFAALTSVEPPLQLAFLGFAKDQSKIIDWADNFLRPLDARLGVRDWIAADQFTAADILLNSVLRLGEKAGALEPYRNLTTYRKRCEERPAWRRTIEQYEDRLGIPRGAASL